MKRTGCSIVRVGTQIRQTLFKLRVSEFIHIYFLSLPGNMIDIEEAKILPMPNHNVYIIPLIMSKNRCDGSIIALLITIAFQF